MPSNPSSNDNRAINRVLNDVVLRSAPALAISASLRNLFIAHDFDACKKTVTEHMIRLQMAKDMFGRTDPVREKSVKADLLIEMSSTLELHAYALYIRDVSINDFVKEITNYIFEDGKQNGSLGDRAWWASTLTSWWREWEKDWKQHEEERRAKQSAT